MKQEMYDLAAWGIKEAKAAGSDNSRISIDGERTVEISYRDRKPENIKEASTKGLSLEIFVNGRYSSMSTSDLRKDALKDFIGKAVAQTKLLAEDPFRTLPDPKYYQGRQELDLGRVEYAATVRLVGQGLPALVAHRHFDDPERRNAIPARPRHDDRLDRAGGRVCESPR